MMTSVFIVENDFSLQILYKRILEYGGFRVLGTAITGKEAILKYKKFERRPDIVLLDYRMPMMNGFEITKEILKMDEGARIIIASGDITAKKLALEIGAKKFLKKPFTSERLLTEIRDLTINISAVMNSV